MNPRQASSGIPLTFRPYFTLTPASTHQPMSSETRTSIPGCLASSRQRAASSSTASHTVRSGSKGAPGCQRYVQRSKGGSGAGGMAGGGSLFLASEVEGALAVALLEEEEEVVPFCCCCCRFDVDRSPPFPLCELLGASGVPDGPAGSGAAEDLDPVAASDLDPTEPPAPSCDALAGAPPAPQSGGGILMTAAAAERDGLTNDEVPNMPPLFSSLSSSASSLLLLLLDEGTMERAGGVLAVLLLLPPFLADRTFPPLPAHNGARETGN